MIHMDEKEKKEAIAEEEADYEKFADAVKKETTTISPKDEEKIKAFMEKMNMPIELKDEDIQMGAREIDVRNLSTKAYRQLVYKFTLKKMGTKDVVGELDELCEEIQKQAKELAKKRKA